MAGEKSSLREAVRWTFLSLFLFLLAEGLLFRSGLYLPYLTPHSTTGKLELIRYLVFQARPTATPEVIVLGDSRIAEGFSARVATAEVGGRVHFWNGGDGGTSPRIWYYFMRDVDPTRRRFAAVVIPFDHYSDQDDPEPYDRRIIDLNYVVGRLRVTDCPEFARSMNSDGLFLQALTGCLLKGRIFRDDLNDLIAQGPKRLKESALWRRDGLDFLEGYPGKPEVVSGISADWTHRRIDFPPNLTELQKATIMGTVMPRIIPQTGNVTRYRRAWLQRILDLYAQSDTRIIFFELPRAPLPIPDGPIPPYFINSVRARPNLTVLPASTFRDLERPEYFADGLHLNRAGRPIFSKRLAGLVAATLGGH